jgi:hypothetical protein
MTVSGSGYPTKDAEASLPETLPDKGINEKALTIIARAFRLLQI